MRARWLLGLLVVSSASALSCGSADTANLFTGASVTGGGAGASGEANHAGAGSVAGAGAGISVGGATPQSGGTGGSAESGAPSGGSGMASSGAPAGGTSGSPGKGGSAGTGGSAGHGGTAGSGGGHAGSAGTGGATAGAGGTAGASGGSAGTGGSNAGSAGSAGSGPTSCTSNAGCAATEYCAKADCADQTSGTCTAKPTDCSNVVAAPVCGCDGVTYHDACLLHSSRQNGLAAQPPGGVCGKAAVGTLTCTAFDSSACTAKNGVCSNKDDSCSGPTLPNASGVCWVIPEACPAADPKPVMTCGGENACRSECAVLKAKVRYALSDSCTSG